MTPPSSIARFVLMALWLSVLGGAVRGEGVRVTVEPESVFVGQPFYLHLEVDAPRDAEVHSPAVPDKTGSVERLDLVEQSAKGSIRRYAAKLAAFELGGHAIPPIEVAWTLPDGTVQAAQSTTATVHVDSYLATLETGEATPPSPIRPPLDLPTNWRPWWIALGALAALALAVWLIRRFWPRRETQAMAPMAPPLLDPVEEALRALAAVEQERLAERDTAKNYYTRLSEILRRYLGRRFGFDALEMTSSELTDFVSRLRWDGDTFQLFTTDLHEADSVKFARYQPPMGKRTAALERVRHLVNATRPASPEPNAKPEEAAAHV